MRPLLFNCWEGLGDNIYVRPFVRELSLKHELYVRTPWPELFEDLDVRFVRPEAQYRTQSKNVDLQQPWRWSRPPADIEEIQPYISRDSGSIPEGIAASLNMSPGGLTFDLPRHLYGAKMERPVALVRPVVVRKEWQNESRNPLPEYVFEASQILREQGFEIWSVADLAGGAEWMLEPAPMADVVLHHGELGIRELLQLTSAVSIVVGGVGWIVPAAPALRTKLICICGGNGAHNAPEWLVGPPMDPAWIEWVVPDSYCRCDRMDHDCGRTITDFESKFRRAMAALL